MKSNFGYKAGILLLAIGFWAGKAWAVDGARSVETSEAEIDASNLSKPPKLTLPATPEFPKAALEKGAAAEITLLLDLAETGEVTGARVVAPLEPTGLGFEDAAILAAYQLHFEPAELAGKPVGVQITYVFKFIPPVSPVPAVPVENQAKENPLAEVAPPPRPPVKNFTGVLQERGTRSLLSGITVTIYRSEAGTPAGFEAITDENGKFEFIDLAPGSWKVLVETPGYYPFRTVEEIRPGEQVQARYFVEKGTYSPFDIVVTAPKPRKEVTRVVIDSATIDKVPGAMGDPLAVIQNFAGVARVDSMMTGEIVVRGSAPKDTKVFIEGVEVPFVYHFLGLRSVVPTGMIETLDFYPGNFSPYYGRAVGAAIDVSLKKSKAKKANGYVDINLLDAGLYLEVPFTEKFTLAVAGRRSYIDYILKAVIPDDAPIKMITPPVYYDFQVLATYRPAPAHDLRLFLIGSDDRFAMIFNNPGELGTEFTDNRMNLGTTFQRAIATYRYVPHDRLENTLRLAQGRELLDLKFAQFIENLQLDSTQVRDTFRYQLSNRFTGVAGADLILQHWTGFVRMPRATKEGESHEFEENISKVYETKVDEYHYLPGLFAEMEVQPIRSLLFLPGVRFDYYSKIKAATLAPRLTARYGITEQIVLKGGVGLFYQEPSVDESNEGFGNPKLKPERALHSSLGVEWRPRKHLSLDATVFHKAMDNLVSRTTATQVVDGKVQELHFDSHGKGRVYGLELVAKHEMNNKFTGWLAYTLSRAERRDTGDYEYRLFQYDQTHILTVVAMYQLPRNWQVSSRFRLTSGNPWTPIVGAVNNLDSDEYVPTLGATYSSRNPMFAQLDLRIDKKWIYNHWMLSAYLEIQNITNRENVQGLDYNYNYSKSSPRIGLPIYPILGLRGEF